MRLIIVDNSSDVANYAAGYVAKRIRDFAPTANRPFVLGLPTGSTPLGMYRRLIEEHQAGRLSFEHVVTFNMDEYVGLPRSHEQSYHTFMYQNFFRHINIDPKNVHILDGEASDIEAECAAYEAKIRDFGGVELFVGGIGSDGHVAFNEPGSSLASRTRLKTLAPETIAANARFFGGDISQVPRQALTVGIGTMMDAREVLILVTGQAKSLALQKAVEEGVSHMWTGSAFQLHQHAMFVADEEATLELKVKTVRYFKALMPTHLKLVEN